MSNDAQIELLDQDRPHDSKESKLGYCRACAVLCGCDDSYKDKNKKNRIEAFVPDEGCDWGSLSTLRWLVLVCFCLIFGLGISLYLVQAHLNHRIDDL